MFHTMAFANQAFLLSLFSVLRAKSGHFAY